jgi:glycine hydroxymethyltransferase
MTIAGFDPELAKAIAGERGRQEDHIELIASENYASPRVLEAQGSVLTNKYAEGYPGKRYYGGCEFVDIAETWRSTGPSSCSAPPMPTCSRIPARRRMPPCISRCSIPATPILGMSLDHGGHLTHGAKVNFSGKLFKAVQYGIKPDTARSTTSRSSELAKEHRPKMIVAGFSAYSRVIDWARFRAIADSVGAYLFVDMAHVAGSWPPACIRIRCPFADVVTTTTHKTLRGPRGGLILARPHADLHKKFNSMVFPGIQGGPLMHVIAAKAVAFYEALQPEFKAYSAQVIANARAMTQVLQERGYKIVSGGTDNHLFLLDLIDKNITGKDADAALGRAHMTVNKNAVPNDPRPPSISSGLRIGTPAVTTRGFKEPEARAAVELDRRCARSHGR